MAWINIPASKSLVDEFNAAFPGRDKASDGTIGDGEHSQTSSDHNPDETGRTPYEDNDDTNEVHARDVDDDLRKAGWSMQRVVDIILARCRSGAEKRIRYIIYNRRIISASWGWGSWHAYDGPSPHTEHAHFSFYYGSGNGVGNPENITSPWGFLAAVQEEGDMPLTNEDADVIIARLGIRMRDTNDQIAQIFKAIPWQYSGGGLQGSTNTLDALTDSQVIQSQVAGLAASVASLTALVTSQSGATAGDIAAALTPAVTAAIATLPGADLTEADVETALRNVLRTGVDSSE